jgi:hypothetical protein
MIDQSILEALITFEDRYGRLQQVQTFRNGAVRVLWAQRAESFRNMDELRKALSPVLVKGAKP